MFFSIELPFELPIPAKDNDWSSTSTVEDTIYEGRVLRRYRKRIPKQKINDRAKSHQWRIAVCRKFEEPNDSFGAVVYCFAFDFIFFRDSKSFLFYAKSNHERCDNRCHAHDG